MGLLLLSGQKEVNKKAGQDFITVDMRPLSLLRQNTRWFVCASFDKHCIRLGYV